MTERRLAAIMFTDIVGYTALMAESEDKGLRAKERHRALVRPLVERYHGEAIEARGDESLSTFPTALDAVNCALAIDEALREGRELKLHIGIHVGEFVVRDGEISGDGVNIAARVCALSAGDGPYVSDEVHHAVQNQANLAFDALGEHELKNVPRPVVVYAVKGAPSAPRPVSRVRSPRRGWSGLWALPVVGALILVGLGVWWLNRPVLNAPPIRSVAVLPFADMSPAGDQEYFADGMAEEIIDALTHVEGLKVVARTSAFAFKGKNEDIREIGRRLDVGAVVEGSVRKAGNRVRITAQLIRVEDGFHLWSESYDRDLNDVFAIQADIARATAAAARIRLASDSPAVRRPTESVDAYELYLLGRHFWYLRTPEGFRKAIDYFEQALEADPEFALPYVGIADTHLLLLAYAAFVPGFDSAGADFSQAEAAVARALALDETSGQAHATLAYVRMFQWRWRESEQEFQLALQLSPGYAPAYEDYGNLLGFLLGRREEALQSLARALELDPLSPAINRNAALHALSAGDHELAIARARRTLELSPGDPFSPQTLSWAQLAQGAEPDRFVVFPGMPPQVEEQLRNAYRAGGGEALFRRAIEMEIARTGEDCTARPAQAVGIFALAGESDRMFACLQGIVDEGALFFVGTANFDPYRADPRFQAILEQMGLEEYY